MDITERKITKIAREAEKFVIVALKQDGVGTAELDFIHTVRHHPGITQAGVRRILNADKGAAARRALSLTKKGYLRQEPDPEDARSRRLYPTEKAMKLRNSKASVESVFYGWLTEEMTADEKANFAKLLDRLYVRSKAESRSDFQNLMQRIDNEGETEKQTAGKDL